MFRIDLGCATTLQTFLWIKRATLHPQKIAICFKRKTKLKIWRFDHVLRRASFVITIVVRTKVVAPLKHFHKGRVHRGSCFNTISSVQPLWIKFCIMTNAPLRLFKMADFSNKIGSLKINISDMLWKKLFPLLQLQFKSKMLRL